MTKAIEQHKRDGTYREDRHAGWEPIPGIPDPVRDDLSEQDLFYRRKYGLILSTNGALTLADGLALDMLATLTSDVCDMQARVRADNFAADDGGKHNLLTPLNQAQTQLSKIMIQFGLTPKSRVGLGKSGGDRDELIEFLEQQG